MVQDFGKHLNNGSYTAFKFKQGPLQGSIASGTELFVMLLAMFDRMSDVSSCFDNNGSTVEMLRGSGQTWASSRDDNS